MKRDNVLYILNLMYDDAVEAEYASPNFVVDFAADRHVDLTVDEVVMISDFYGEESCPTGRADELKQSEGK